jgi:hypothetical protein
MARLRTSLTAVAWAVLPVLVAVVSMGRRWIP